MGFKIDNAHVDVWLSKMEATIKNITFLAVVGNLGVNQLMEREVVTTITTKAVFTKEPKWTTLMAKNVC